MDRVFLDANVLFSAAYAQGSRLLELWLLDDAELVTSLLAVEEARRNLSAHNPGGVSVINELAPKITTVLGTRMGELPEGVELADKDVPIFLAAIDSGCSHFLTGDKQHFGALYGRSIGGVLIQTPSQYLRSRAR